MKAKPKGPEQDDLFRARLVEIIDMRHELVPKNRNTREENKAIKNGEVPEGWAGKPAKRSQKDTDARWTKKHGKSHYGYKNHVNVDRRHKLVCRYHVSDTALHDSQAVYHLLMQENAPGNIAVLRRRVLDVFRQDTSKISLSMKLKRAGWDEKFLCRILNALKELTPER